MDYSETGYWICAGFQHLRSFSLQAENIDEFETTVLAGEIGFLLNALQGRGTVGLKEVARIAKGQRIGVKRLNSNLIPTLQRLNSDRVSVITKDQKVVYIEEHLDSASQLYEIVGRAWETLEPSLIERGAVHILQHTFVAPRTQTEELSLLSNDGLGDEEAESTLGVTTSFRIVQSFEGRGLDEAVLFNPLIIEAAASTADNGGSADARHLRHSSGNAETLAEVPETILECAPTLPRGVARMGNGFAHCR
jgi:hypothetical protein